MTFRTRVIFTAIAVALVGIVTGLLPGCTPSPTSTPTPTPTQAFNEVIILGRALLPDPITVPAGTTVTWTNKDPTTYTVTNNDGLFNAELAFGDSFSYTFNEPGTFTYDCIPHDADEPFDGEVIVE
jgi:plastocyanin